MNLFKVSILASNFLYAIIYQPKLLYIQLSIITIYFIASFLYSSRSKTSVRKKISISTWGRPNDGKLMGEVPLNCEIIDNFIKKFNQKNPETKITYTHFFAKVIGIVFGEMKKFSGKIAFGELVPATELNIGFTIDVGGKNLGLKTVKNCDSLPLSQLKENSRKGFKDVKSNKDQKFNRELKAMKLMPSAFIQFFLDVGAFCSYWMEFSLPQKKIFKDQCGTVLITNLSKFSMPVAYPPLTSFTKTMGIFSITEPVMTPVVEKNLEIVSRKMLNLNFTIDHRFGDGAQGHKMISRIQEIAGQPDKFLI